MGKVVTHRNKDGKQGEEFVFNSFNYFNEIIRDKTCPHYVFRGAQNYNFDLKPRIARKLKIPTNEEEKIQFYQDEKILLEIFKSKVFIHEPYTSHNDWHWLTLAQHYGMATRFLDWTENPLVALYFASIHIVDSDGKPKDINEDGVIYFMHPDSKVYTANADTSPFDNNCNGLFFAPHLEQRMVAQAALFSIHPEPWKEFNTDEEDIVKFRVTANFKKELQKILPKYGFSRRILYADLDSFSSEIMNYLDSTQCRRKLRIFVD